MDHIQNHLLDARPHLSSDRHSPALEAHKAHASIDGPATRICLCLGSISSIVSLAMAAEVSSFLCL